MSYLLSWGMVINGKNYRLWLKFKLLIQLLFRHHISCIYSCEISFHLDGYLPIFLPIFYKNFHSRAWVHLFESSSFDLPNWMRKTSFSVTLASFVDFAKRMRVRALETFCRHKKWQNLQTHLNQWSFSNILNSKLDIILFNLVQIHIMWAIF